MINENVTAVGACQASKYPEITLAFKKNIDLANKLINRLQGICDVVGFCGGECECKEREMKKPRDPDDIEQIYENSLGTNMCAIEDKLCLIGGKIETIESSLGMIDN